MRGAQGNGSAGAPAARRGWATRTGDPGKGVLSRMFRAGFYDGPCRMLRWSERSAQMVNKLITFDPTCPCIDAYPRLLSASLHDPPEVTTKSGWVPGRDYGNRQCRPWDAVSNHPSCANANGSAFCLEEWCYVDGSVCKNSTRIYRASVAFPEVSVDAAQPSLCTE